MLATIGQRTATGQRSNFNAVRDWFVPRYAAWKANPAAVISLEEVVAFLGTDAPWVPATGTAGK
jgi:hypothetical protein